MDLAHEEAAPLVLVGAVHKPHNPWGLEVQTQGRRWEMVQFSAASARNIPISLRAHKSASNGFIHKGEKEEIINENKF